MSAAMMDPTERVPEKLWIRGQITENKELGPGCYNLKDNSQKISHNTQKIPFGSANDRFKDVSQGARFFQKPGPGQYQVESSFNERKSPSSSYLLPSIGSKAKLRNNTSDHAIREISHL